MGQGYSITTLSAGSAGIDIPELADLVYEKSLGTARFMKSIRARQHNGIVFVKVIMKPYPNLELDPYIKAIIRERKVLAAIPNALPYQRVIETATSGYLVRQYIHSSLYDRISTRPFLEDMEKKWISFQLLSVLRDCHAQNIFHGDIKSENVLVTSWNWVYLSDFSSSFKPTYLPEDNPADFSFYFDTSGRRTCYLAPERFLNVGESPDGLQVNWAMDIFSAGCVIAELFLESPTFTLSQLYKYRKGEYNPVQGRLAEIQDPDVRELILHMISIDPESRYSAEECLNFWRKKTFPEYFYSFLHQYMGMITDPSSGHLCTTNINEADNRIERVFLDFDKISYFLGIHPQTFPETSNTATPRLTSQMESLQLDLPISETLSSKSAPGDVDGILLFLTLVVSSLRNTAKASARAKACDILLAFAHKVPDEAKLDRILPFLILLLNDRSDIVKIAAVQSLTQLLDKVQVVSPVNAYIYPEYIFLRLRPLILGPSSNPAPMVRAAYASCIASLAQSSLRVLDMVQALRSDVRLMKLVPVGSELGWADDASYHNLFDVARADLLDFFEFHVKALLTDPDVSVRRAFLGSVSSLCVFFGNPKVNEVILSHLNTYLNDADWMLKCAFFEAVVGVAAYVGSTSVEEFILPLMIQSMADPEEFVVERVLRSLASMANLGLFQRSTTWDLLYITIRFFIHPSPWIREAAVHLVVASTSFLSIADKYCIVSPLVRPFLKANTTDISESQLLDALKKPLPKSVFDMALVWATKAEKGAFWSSAAQDSTFILGGSSVTNFGKLRRSALSNIATSKEDQQWISRLRNLGMGPEDEFKLLSLKEYIWRVAVGRRKEPQPSNTSIDIVPLRQYDVTPQTVIFDKKQGPKQPVYSPAIRKTRSTDDDTEGKTHTIADALLDASTTIGGNGGVSQRNLPNRLSRPQSIEAVSTRQRSPGCLGQDSLEDHSPTLLTDMPESTNSSTAASDSELRNTGNQIGAGMSVTRTSSSMRGSDTASLQAGNEDIRRKHSAINLLNRQENYKANAETATTSTNVLGEVDTPFRGSPSQTQPTMQAAEQSRQYHANHTYRGNDPTILRLLDTVFTENYPTDLFDFGPIVMSISSKAPIKKASGHSSNMPWRPQGTLVAMFGEHTGPVNRVAVAPDHAFFVTASDDGTVKVWDTNRLEKNLTPRSRQTHHHDAGAKVKCVTFVENTYTFISAATDGSVHAIRIDYQNINDTPRYGKPRLVREYRIMSTVEESEYAVWMEHYRTDLHSMLLMATSRSRIIALDLKSMKEIFILQNPVQYGIPTTFCVDRKRNWLLVGTTHGIMNLWDLRFCILMKSWGLPGGTQIHRLVIHPLKGRGRWVCVAGGGSNSSEIMVWDIDKAQCREVYRTAITGNSPSTNGANKATATQRNAHFTPDTTWKAYEPWRVDDEKPESLLSRFAATSSLEPSSNSNISERNGICAITVGLDVPDPNAAVGAQLENTSSSKCGFLVSGGADRIVRFWDTSHPDASTIVSAPDFIFDSPGTSTKPRYEITHPTPSLTITTEWLPSPGASNSSAGRPATDLKKGSSTVPATRPSRNTMISVQQQQLLRSHLDMILDVAVLEVPYGMTVSVDRGGMIYVFQ
ncbi:Serine/threonine-protein kinase [Ophidiomyces ophidiicola]|nr:Serine/threonine-protein kinase [Ophidiomyces ophidiicola]KAI1988675.1 Serine/threonine-protein kinase [Ophidiomyces ophidiicola]KAI1989392.1 Serine/threonine-protein kinase [Ophidiomyces ophidiicola]KAI1990994.1 Serine/threonine-protein kinase [Ophidiomyces ophidiicola]